MMNISELRVELNQLVDPIRAKSTAWFFKTGKGQYGEGDRFLGITVPNSRKIAKKFQHLSMENIQKLLYSEYHEERLVRLLILTHQFQKGLQKQKIVDCYLANTSQINNWDLVDTSAHKILGS